MKTIRGVLTGRQSEKKLKSEVIILKEEGIIMAEKKRVQFIDMVRGLTILCISVYHIVAPGILKTFTTGIIGSLFFSFFFFSGYFYVAGKKPIGENIASRAKSLLGTFVSYSLAFWMIGSVILLMKKAETIIDALCCLRNFYGGSIWNRTIQDFFGWEYHSLGSAYPFLADFWFLPALFIASVLFIVIAEKIAKTAVTQMIAILVLLCITGILRYNSVMLPYNLQLIPFWAALVLIGYTFKMLNVFDKLQGNSSLSVGILSTVISIGASVYLAYGTNLFRGTFDEPEVLTMIVVFVLGVLSIYGVSLVCKYIEDTNINVDKFAYLGSHSIYLYLYHVFVAWLICQITGFSMRYDPENMTNGILAKSIILAIVSIGLSILISVAADKLKRRK